MSEPFGHALMIRSDEETYDMDHATDCPAHPGDAACKCSVSMMRRKVWTALQAAHSTEQSMHKAWRKRAEEAEIRIAALEAELAQARAECERLLEVLMQMIELAEYWFTRENRQGYSEQQYKAWHSLGFGSTAMRNARSAIDAALAKGE